VSSIIIDQSKDLPVSLTYRQRFGSLGRVYQLVGYLQQRADRSIEINPHTALGAGLSQYQGAPCGAACPVSAVTRFRRFEIIA
jgi:hypothetical protein